MYRYQLIASFNRNLDCLRFDCDSETSTFRVELPLLTPKGDFRYGLQAMVNKLSEQHIYPSESGYDAIIIGLMVYIADMKISRARHSQNSWSREISLVIPVFDEKWTLHQNILEKMLKFLTGDFWTLEFSKREIEFVNNDIVGEKTDEYMVASLFSGGMDSLIAAINLMEHKTPTLFVSHAGEGRVRNWQTNLMSILDERYGDISHWNAYLWTDLSGIVIPASDQDKNQRSRSFLFIAIAIFAMTGTNNCVKLLIPENGLIALNVPLDSTRIGSHSTRTTHPFYLKLWNEVLYSIFGYSISNPYLKKTKGEMLIDCLNQEVIRTSIERSFSCSSVNSANIRGGRSQHCGHCLPCIIRRAAIYCAYGSSDPSEYLYSNVSDIRNNRGVVGEHLRSLEYAIDKMNRNPNIARAYIHKPGPLDDNETYLKDLTDMYSRGLMEIDRWLNDSVRNEDVN